MNRQQQEVDQNYEAFQTLLLGLMDAHFGQHALMKDRRVLAFFSTPADALAAARAFIPDGLYSIQCVTGIRMILGGPQNAANPTQR